MALERSAQPDETDFEAATDAAIAACDGDLRATIRALIVANDFLTRQNEALSAELDYAWKWVSPGFTRSTLKRRMKSGKPRLPCVQSSKADRIALVAVVTTQFLHKRDDLIDSSAISAGEQTIEALANVAHDPARSEWTMGLGGTGLFRPSLA